MARLLKKRKSKSKEQKMMAHEKCEVCEATPISGKSYDDLIQVGLRHSA